MSKPWTESLVVVTATADLGAAKRFVDSWIDHASFEWSLVVVENGGREVQYRPAAGRLGLVYRPTFLGSVPAFALGVDAAAKLAPQAKVIACLHDDVEIREFGWDAHVMAKFANAQVGLASFSGALGLGSADIYRTPYSPMQLARQDFLSNLSDAEMHGRRETHARRIVCGDGFSIIGRAAWWWDGVGPAPLRKFVPPPWSYLVHKGVVHHAYDSWFGILAARAGYEAWYLPIACHHAGGRTAVANTGYAEWAAPKGGDSAFWEQAHLACYEDGRDLLPLRV